MLAHITHPFGLTFHVQRRINLNMRLFFSRFCHASSLRRVVVTLVVLVWNSFGFCDEIPNAVMLPDTPINGAASDDDLEKVKSLLKDNPDLAFSTNDSGFTPLHSAAGQGHRDIVELLLANKANVDARDKIFGETPLHAAAYGNYKDVVDLLLANKADIDARNKDGETPLYTAAFMGCKDVAELLLANKADANAKNKYGRTPLDTAAERNHVEVAKLLLAHGADVNIKDNNGDTALHFAAGNGGENVVKLLLTSKADVNAKDNDGGTPLDAATFSGNQGVMELLLASKAVVNINDAVAEDDVKKVKALLKDNPDLIFSKDGEGETPLHLAVLTLQKDVAKLLLAKGADVNARNMHGQTPLLMATESDYLVMGMARKLGANKEPTKEDWEQFFNLQDDLVGLLLASKADVNAKDEDGNMPLHLAASEENKDLARLLLAYKADVNARNKSGETPLKLAEDAGFKDTVELLRQHGGHE